MTKKDYIMGFDPGTKEGDYSPIERLDNPEQSEIIEKPTKAWLEEQRDPLLVVYKDDKKQKQQYSVLWSDVECHLRYLEEQHQAYYLEYKLLRDERERKKFVTFLRFLATTDFKNRDGVETCNVISSKFDEVMK